MFTFVRNPWARAISSWHHIHNRGVRPRCQDDFATFAELPSRYGAKCLDRWAGGRAGGGLVGPQGSPVGLCASPGLGWGQPCQAASCSFRMLVCHTLLPVCCGQGEGGHIQLGGPEWLFAHAQPCTGARNERTHITAPQVRLLLLQAVVLQAAVWVGAGASGAAGAMPV